MPRVRSSTSAPYDFCAGCFPTEADALAEFGDVGDGPDDRGNCFAYDDHHPGYDGLGYQCHECRAELTADDDLAPEPPCPRPTPPRP